MTTVFKKIILTALILAICIFQTGIASAISGQSVRIKDITHIKGVRENQVVGYGLVVGLQNTGDNSRHTQMTNQLLLQNLGTVIDQSNYIQKGASAAVIVTATIPPFAKNGDKVDVVVSAMADAKSLEGGVLVQTQLRAPNGEIVAVAQGPLSVGGASAKAAGSSSRTAITTTGRIPGGAIVERDIISAIGDENSLTLILDQADYTMAAQIANIISRNVSDAIALDGGSIKVSIPQRYLTDRIAFISILENIRVSAPQERAKVIINERTGTVVIGADARLMPAAVAHGGITVTIQAYNDVSQPAPFSPQGQTVGVTNAQIDIEKKEGSLVEMKANSTLGELVNALNSIGVTPTDLIAILQALRMSGSLQAELQII